MKPRFKVSDRVIIAEQLGCEKPSRGWSQSIKEVRLISYKYKGNINKRVEYALWPYGDIYNEKELILWKRR